MADTHVEVKHVGCFSKLMESLKNLVGAVVLLFIAVALLFGNEYMAVRGANNLAAGEAAVVAADPATVNAANEGKLVHMSGQATTGEMLSDAQFGVTVNALKLTRSVEMYQWQEKQTTETKKNVGGSEERITTSTYSNVWDDDLISSAGFKEQAGHVNPSVMPYQALTVVAREAKLGAFTLTEGLLKSISATTGVPNLPQPAIPNAKLNGNGYYLGANPAVPVVGDVRVTFAMVAPQVISIIARQTGGSFSPYETGSGTIEMIEAGTKTAAQMFASAKAAGSAMKWGLRVLGWLLIFAGVAILFQPLVVIADVIPFIGNMLQRGVTLISLIIATPIALVVIIVSWVVVKFVA